MTDLLKDNPWAETIGEVMKESSDGVAVAHAILAVAYEIAAHRLVMERFHATANQIRTQMELERRSHK